MSRSARDDRGDVAVLVTVIVATVVAFTALIVDGGARIKATNQADTYAWEAARAASTANGLPVAGSSNEQAAESAAQSYFTQAGVAGTAMVVGPGRVEVAVTVTRSAPITGMSFTVTRVHTAQLQIGVETGQVPQ